MFGVKLANKYKKFMTEKNFERMFFIVIIIIYAIIGYFAYQRVIKPTAKAALQFFNASNATQQIESIKPQTYNTR